MRRAVLFSSLVGAGAAVSGCGGREAEPSAPHDEARAIASAEDSERAEVVGGAAEGVVAFEGVFVLPMDADSGVLEDHTVVIRDGRIAEIGPAHEVSAPEGAQIIAGEGRYLLPGFAEMHAHLPGPDVPDEEVEELLFLYLANGVTTLRGMLGFPSHLELRDQIESGERLGPTIFAGSPPLSGDTAATGADGGSAVRELAGEGYDLIKLHPGISREVYDQIVKSAGEEGITWAGHVSPEVGLEHSFATGKSTIDHLDGYVEAVASEEVRDRLAAGDAVPVGELVDSATDRRIEEVAEATREAGTWNVPTAYLWELFYGDAPAAELAAKPEMQYAAEPQIEQWTKLAEDRFFVDLLEGWRTGGELGADDVSAEDGEALIELRRRILAALDEAGAGILLGTDSPQMFMVPGFSLHHEIGVMAQAGMAPLDILKAGTRNVAEYANDELGYDEDFGRVRAGARADLVLVDGNPLEDLNALQKPRGVMVRGHWLSRDEIRHRLSEIAKAR